ncbi:MAG: HDIG domain-containing protein, partial [Rhodothermales bacterium]|nr:HDIG domain-containing protein [Rhodothermales bacterium]
QIFDSARHMTAITLVMTFVIALFGIAVWRAELEMLAVPVALAAVLFTVVYDSRVGIFATLTLAIVGGHLLRYDLGYTFATLFACTLVAFSVRDLRNRGQFFISAAILFAAYAAVLYAGYLVGHQSAPRLAQDLLQVGIQASLLLLAYPLLWVFERVFGVTTELTLLELSHPSRPLLTELQAVAPGTYSHSLQVASLADACATAVGADALLTRVGALYHDIGKMKQPGYFIENQRRGENPHDELTPHLSALVIASHVKEGVEIARLHRLPDVVTRFITRHHGTTRIEYFYRRALEQHVAGEPEVDEQDYRYPGPRPESKEMAILMLCDGCEAASRTLDDPTPQKLTALVDGIIEARRADGQLDRSDLTFDDLRRIRDTIIRMLVGHYHGRIKYPGGEKEDRDAPKTDDEVPAPKLAHEGADVPEAEPRERLEPPPTAEGKTTAD